MKALIIGVAVLLAGCAEMQAAQTPESQMQACIGMQMMALNGVMPYATTAQLLAQATLECQR